MSNLSPPQAPCPPRDVADLKEDPKMADLVTPTCPECGCKFAVTADDAARTDELSCPVCAEEVPVPGMDEDTFEDAVDGLTAPDLIEWSNGVPVFANGDPVTVDLVRDAQFVTSGFGRYLVFIKGLGFAATTDGQRYEINMRRFIEQGRRGRAGR